jgi:hypothetical protein
MDGEEGRWIWRGGKGRTDSASGREILEFVLVVAARA